MDLLKCPDKAKSSNGGGKPNTLTGEMHQLAGGKNLLLELERQISITLGKNSSCICKLSMQIQHLHYMDFATSAAIELYNVLKNTFI